MFIKYIKLLTVIFLSMILTGCFYWWRAYQTYSQMSDFDQYFTIRTADDSLSVYFKEPILYSSDFVELAKLRPSREEKTAQGKLWRYQFRKVNAQEQLIFPEIEFSINLNFNHDNRITRCTFSPLFLQIAPPEFLELSIRSVGRGEINQATRQLKVDADKIKKINASLPLKRTILEHLGMPLEIIDQKMSEIYVYHFMLDTQSIEPGYEERRLSLIQLTFNKATQEMTKMAGSFAGLKIAINYQQYQKKII